MDIPANNSNPTIIENYHISSQSQSIPFPININPINNLNSTNQKASNINNRSSDSINDFDYELIEFYQE